MAMFDRVKFDGLKSRDWIIYKYPSENLVFGSQVIVSEGQAAIFVNGGRVCDIFGPGSYTLDTANLPILQSLLNIPFGRKTPFPAEIYYINTVTKLDLYWGTVDPIQIIDPKYCIELRVRAFGQLGLKLANYALFFKELIGAMNSSDIVVYEKVVEFYKGILTTKIKSAIADIIINDKISALEISAKLDKISADTAEKLRPDFERYGFNIINFCINSINFPNEDFDRINKILQDRAAFDIMGDRRYAMKRSFDVYETAAGNENGVAGAFAAGGVGLGAGVALASNISAPNLTTNTDGKDEIICPNCKKSQPADAKFCSECGTPLTPLKCSCGATLNPGDKFCPKCGKKVGES